MHPLLFKNTVDFGSTRCRNARKKWNGNGKHPQPEKEPHLPIAFVTIHEEQACFEAIRLPSIWFIRNPVWMKI